MFYIFLYSISIIMHCIAIYIGFRTLDIGMDSFFQKTNIKDIFSVNPKKRFIEMIYMAIISSVSTNIVFILYKTGYILIYEGSRAGYLEPLLLMGHLLSGFAFILYHWVIYIKIENSVIHENI